MSYTEDNCPSKSFPDFGDVSLFRRIFHWGPLIAIFIISTITMAGLLCDLMWWPPLSSPAAFLNIAVYLTWLYMVMFFFLNACSVGPGFVPYGWTPVNWEDTQYLQFCSLCRGYKPPRAHHCRKCGRCVMKMDHHCPWINNCCGHYNHFYFTAFLFIAPVGCLHAALIIIPSMYRAFYRNYYIYYGIEDVPLVYLGIYGLLVCFLAVGLAVGVVIAVWMLFYLQIKSILRNETGIETWIIEKAEMRERAPDEPDDFVYPYDLGWRENLRQVVTWNGRPRSDGFTYPVVDGCTQYTLTTEQLHQKRDKDTRRVTYVATAPYSGAIWPITQGFRVNCCVPCSDEPRIALRPDDRVSVTRWKKHWLYGERILSSSAEAVDESKLTPKELAERRQRGWFPRKCVTTFSEWIARNRRASNHCTPEVTREDDVQDSKEEDVPIRAEENGAGDWTNADLKKTN